VKEEVQFYEKLVNNSKNYLFLFRTDPHAALVASDEDENIYPKPTSPFSKGG
jgi:hypothetical protein